METWLLLLTTLLVALLITLLLSLLLKTNKKKLEAIIRNLQARYGPIISLRIGSRPAIFISNRHLAHQALIQNGAVFADRPPALLTSKIISGNQHNITSAFYGPTWRLLRGNLTSEMLNPSRVKSYSGVRKWVLHVLSNRLTESDGVEGVRVVDHLQYAMFCLLVVMCFGDKFDETQIKKIETVQQGLLLGTGPSGRFNLLNIWPAFTKIVLKKRWEEFFQMRKDQKDVLLPMIRARKEAKLNNESEVVAYVDTLWDLEFPDEKRKPTEDEIISLCSEFLIAGTVTTFTALHWIMANIIKYPAVQERLVTEIKGVVGETEEEVKEEDLQKMPYLKAVILEGLRRHPPAHFVLPHAVSQDVVLDGYLVPKKGTVNFMVADMGRDPEVWEDPMAFKPERFLSGGEGEGVDITGSREIKMMPFGVGKRICAGLGLAVLHLEYFVVNLVWKFEWRGVEGEDVDLAEKQEFTIVMKNPLKAHISPRVIKGSGF